MILIIPNVSAATITPPAKDVIALENHVISCVLGDIPEQVIGVTWDPATETSGEYNLLDGSESSNSQTSTLTITASKLQSLDKLSSGVHTFTCSFTIGTTPVTVTATQTITIFNPSKISKICSIGGGGGCNPQISNWGLVFSVSVYPFWPILTGLTGSC